MTRIITDYLNVSAARCPDKIAFADENTQLTFKELQQAAYHIANGIIQLGLRRQPVAIFLEKSPACIAAFMGTAYSGNFYTPMDTKMPCTRIEKIFATLQPRAIITDATHKEELLKYDCRGAKILLYEELQQQPVKKVSIDKATEQIIDTDILYVMFTSGSTGTPKGVVISHRAVIDHAEWAAEAFDMNGTDVFANQSPFYFDHSILEIYQTLRNAATLYILPKLLFSFPKKLMAYLKDRNVNCIIWVPSALCFLANFKAVEQYHLPELRKVMFGGETMPVKQLNIWRTAYPEVLFVNLYGPTEATDDSTYYIVERALKEDEPLPIGRACRNVDVFLLDEHDRLITEEGVLGELCVRGTSLAYGYYRNPKQTAAAFVQNPLQQAYMENIYRTGDLVRYNQYGEIVYVCRKDFQIKHLGQRIELGEIETAVSAVDGVETNCCLYDERKSQIVLFYTGTIEGADIVKQLKCILPDYMLPNRKIQLDAMPLSLNGKIDRLKLKKEL